MQTRPVTNPQKHLRLGLLVLQDGVVLTDFRGEAPGCLPSPAQRAGWMVQRAEKGQRPGHL